MERRFPRKERRQKKESQFGVKEAAYWKKTQGCGKDACEEMWGCWDIAAQKRSGGALKARGWGAALERGTPEVRGEGWMEIKGGWRRRSDGEGWMQRMRGSWEETRLLRTSVRRRKPPCKLIGNIQKIWGCVDPHNPINTHAVAFLLAVPSPGVAGAEAVPPVTLCHQ